MKSSKKLDFLIMYEVTTREMESVILLGNELMHRGYTVDYFSFDNANPKKYIQNRKYIKKYYNNVRVVLMPSLYHDKEVYELVHYVCGDCEQIVNLRWEQAFTFETEKNYDGYHYPHGDAKKAYHLCWGRASYDNMLNAGVEASKLLLCGPLHMDFLREQFSEYYLNREELFNMYGVPTDKKCVLFISSFAISARTDRQIKREESDAGSKLFFDDVIERERRSRETALKWLEEMVQVGDCSVIYRPHPVENVLGDLEELQKKYDNFFVIPKHSVKQWILRCDTVTTWISTSIAEAYFARKSCLIMRPYPIPREREMCLYEGAKLYETKEDFLSAVAANTQDSIAGEVILRHYDFGEIPSYVRLSDELEKIYKSETPFPWDAQKVKPFQSRKWSYIVKSLLIYLYIPLINGMGWLREKTGLSWGASLNARVDGYRKALTTRYVREASKEVIEDLTDRISKCM